MADDIKPRIRVQNTAKKGEVVEVKTLITHPMENGQRKDAAGNVMGNHVKVKVVKNKVAPPFAEAEFDILFNHGIDKEGSALDVATTLGVVEKKGAWLQFAGELIGQGKEAAQKALAEKPELAKKIVDAILAKRAGIAAAAAAA